MNVLALASEQIVLWQVVLAVAAVVVVVVIALLTLLVKLVADVHDGVEGLWTVAKNLAANTATILQVERAAQALDEVGAELQRHAELRS